MELINFLFAEEQLLITATLSMLIVMLIVVVVTDKLKKYSVVDNNAAIKLMDAGDIVILDNRTDKERASGYIANDMHIPFTKIKDNLDKLGDNNKNILTYCHNGMRSAHVAKILTKNGFTNVYNLQGGIKAWNKDNLPVKRDKVIGKKVKKSNTKSNTKSKK